MYLHPFYVIFVPFRPSNIREYYTDVRLSERAGPLLDKPVFFLFVITYSLLAFIPSGGIWRVDKPVSRAVRASV